MDAPVQGSASQLSSLLDEKLRRVCLLEEEQIQAKGEETHNGNKVRSPSPSEVGVNDETADEGCKQRARENSHREQGDRYSSRPVVEHVRERGGDDGERAGAEETGEESADQNRLKVLGRGSREREDGETKHANDQWQSPPLQLRQRGP